MLTLGLMEGVLSATVGALLLFGAANENAPLHRVFGPLVTVTVGFAAYGIHASGAVSAASDVVGLAFFAFIGFFAPVGIMRACWKASKALDARPTARPATRAAALTVAPVVVTSGSPAEQPPGRKVA